MRTLVAVILKQGVLERRVARLNLTYKELAARLETNDKYIRDVRSGAALPGPKLRAKLLDVLGLEFDDLFTVIEEQQWHG